MTITTEPVLEIKLELTAEVAKSVTEKAQADGEFGSNFDLSDMCEEIKMSLEDVILRACKKGESKCMFAVPLKINADAPEKEKLKSAAFDLAVTALKNNGFTIAETKESNYIGISW